MPMNLKLPTPALPQLRLPRLAAAGTHFTAPDLSRPGLPRWTHQVGWRTVMGALLLGGVLHVSATLAIPQLGPGAAYRKLQDALPANTMVVVAPAQPGKQLLPYMIPDAFYAICRYTVAEGPVAVTAPIGEAGWALSLHTPQGENFYVVPSQQLDRTDLSLVLVPGGDRGGGDLFRSSPRSGALGESQVASPSLEGLIVIRAPLKGLAWRAQTETLLSRAKCTPVPKS
jgi:uncharacterized membrane protein